MNQIIQTMQEMRVSEHSDTSSLSTNSQQSMNENKRLVAETFEIRERLGQGSFGEIRLAKDVRNNGCYVAIKFEHKSDIKQHLKTEYQVYSKLTNEAIGFPNMYWFGSYGDYTCLVMDRLGLSLKTLFVKCKRMFPVSTVALIAVQLLDRLETLHDKGWLHQDLKPENIVIGYGDNKHTLYLIDYGTSEQYIDLRTKKHRARKQSTRIVGTARYSSLNNHYGYTQSRRDDLESLGYTLIYFLLGKLPWQGIVEKDLRIKWQKVRQIKRSTSTDELCRLLPVQFRIYMKYVFKLTCQARPNYGYLRGLFNQLVRIAKMNGKETDNPNTRMSTHVDQFVWEELGIVL